MEGFRLRPFEDDYALLDRLSNYQVPQDPAGNAEWLRNRQAFDESSRRRRHYIAMVGEEAVGYASIEQERGEGYRLYVVFDPRRWGYEELGEAMYAQLVCDAEELGAGRLAFTEYANDDAFFDFLYRRGFVEVGTATYNGFEIRRVERDSEYGEAV